jgi:hypothetical protein
MSLSSCLDKVSNEIRRKNILLQKDKKHDEAAAYVAEQNAALEEIKSSLGDIEALDGNDSKAIAKLNSMVESLSLDRDELVVQIEAKGGKVEPAKSDDTAAEKEVTKVVPSGKGIFVDRITGEEVHITDAQRDFLKKASDKEAENIAAGNAVGKFKIFGFDGSTFLAITAPNSDKWSVVRFEDDGRLTGAKEGTHNGLMGFAFDDRRVDVVQKKDYDKAKAQEAKIAADGKVIAEEEAKPTWYEYKGVISVFPRNLIKMAGRWYRIGTDDKLLLVGRRSGDASLLDSINNNSREWVPSKKVNVSPEGRVLFDRDTEVKELPVTQLTFEQWLQNRFDASEYKDTYLKQANGDKRQAMFDVNGYGGTEKSARQAYMSEMLNQPRDSDIPLEAYDDIKDSNVQIEMLRHFFGIEKKINERNMANAIESNRVEAEAIKPYQDLLDEVNAEIKKLSDKSGPTTAKENALLKRRYVLEGAINDIRQGKKPDGRILRNKDDSEGSESQSTTKSIKDENGNTVTEVTLPSGKKVEIQRLTSGESMGLPGWHGPSGYLADTKEQAIKELERKDVKPDAATVTTENAAVDAKKDTLHLDALRVNLSNEKSRLAEAKTDKEREMRSVWVKQLEKEVADEIKLLGIADDASVDMSDDALLDALGDDGAKNDRNTYSVKRYNNETNAIDEESFSRGEYVRVASVDAGASGKESFGEISGVSHANQEAKIGEVWYSFGQIYKAEKPEKYEQPKVSIDSVIDAINKKNGEGITEADRVPNTNDIVGQHSATIAKMVEGDLSIDEFNAAFELVVNNQPAIEAELAKLKKDELLNMGGSMMAYRYKTETKPVIIRKLFNKMLDDFVLGDSISYSYGQKYEDVIRGYVSQYNQQSLDDYAQKIKERREKDVQKSEEFESSIADPKTLDDFKLYMRNQMANGKTFQEARMSLSLEQRISYDDLSAEESRKSRSERKETDVATVAATSVTTAGELFETKHTKTGEDLYVVKTADRVERDIYSQWLATAKRLGGYYSSFRGNGAIPGFTFKSKESAEAFMQFVGGDTAAAKEVIKEERSAYADDKSQSAVERLNEMADRLEERADESLGQERKANTERRARFAASAEAAANSDKALAKTMRNIASAISEGSAKFLDRVRQKSQVEILRGAVSQAKYQELNEKYTSYANRQQHQGEPATAETIDFARWPQFTAMRSDLAALGRDLLQIDGAKKIGQQLLKVADDVSKAYTKFAKENLHKVSTFTTSDGKPAVFSTEDKALAAINRSGYKGKAAVVSFKRGEHMVVMGPELAKEKGYWDGDTDKRITLTAEFGEELVAKNKALGKRNRISMPYIFDNVSQERARWKALGIETPAEMRAALREFVGLQERPAESDKIKQMERAMVGRKNDGLDFFPTPSTTAQDMIDAAEIKPGMTVLEPSAGWGHIAEKIREAGVDPDVVEYGSDRRELLEAKGFRVAGNDFMEITPRGFTFGDVFKDEDGNLGVMRGGGGLGSNRVGFQPLDESGNPDARSSKWVDRDSLTGVEKRAADSGYDRIIMNPPFSDRRDAEHVQHAFTLLKPGGRIVAIMGEGVFFGQDAKAKSFREWLDSVGGTSEKLEEGTFLDPSLPVNTGVNARMVVIDKSEQANESPAFSNNEESIPADEWMSESEILDYIVPTLSQFSAEIPVRIIDTVDENLARKLGVEDSNVFPSGFVHNGKIHLVRSGLRDRDALNRTLFHELLHFGIRRFLPKGQYIEVMNQLFESDKAVRSAAKAWLNTEEAQELYKKTGDAKYVMARATDEALAAVSEQINSNNIEKVVIVNDKKGTFLQNVKDWLAMIARKFGMNSVADMLDPPAKTKDEVKPIKVDIEKATEDFVLSIFSKLKNNENPSDATRSWAYSDAAFMTAWHGSPHDHNKFDSSKIGTGEGAQSFGYGHYFASSKDVADYYRKSLTATKALSEGQFNKDGTPNRVYQAAFQIDAGIANEDVLDGLEVLGLSNSEAREVLRDAQSLFKKLEKESGKLYQVELAPSEDEYLDWDKPLSEQSDLVRNAIDGFIGGASYETIKYFSNLDSDGYTGKDFYTNLKQSFFNLAQPHDAQEASSFLHSVGIRGIRYLDGSSRSAGEGNSNYVIFSDDDVSITAKFAKDSKHTNETPESIRNALTERFGEKGVAALEKVGMLKIVRFNDAPSSILETAIENDASAIYTKDGVAYLFADRMTKQDAPGKLLHELGEHHGLESMIGEDGWNRMKKRIVTMAKVKGSIAYGAWKGVKQNYNEFDGSSDEDLANNERFLHEVLAAIGENKTGQKTSLWRELLAKIKNWLSSKGILSDWMNEGDIVNLVNGSLKKIMRDASDGLVARSTMSSIITDHFKQIIDLMKAENTLIEDCA